MKRLVPILVLMLLSALAGCNTMQGLGKDVERGGEKLQDEARDARR
jgi:entericidin B